MLATAGGSTSAARGQALLWGSVFWISHTYLLELGAEACHGVAREARRNCSDGCKKFPDSRRQMRVVYDSHALCLGKRDQVGCFVR